MSDKTKAILMRFVKGAVSGAVTALGMITVVTPTSWEQLALVINILAIAGIAGAINGVILAGQKWYSWKE